LQGTKIFNNHANSFTVFKHNNRTGLMWLFESDCMLHIRIMQTIAIFGNIWLILLNFYLLNLARCCDDQIMELWCRQRPANVFAIFNWPRNSYLRKCKPGWQVFVDRVEYMNWDSFLHVCQVILCTVCTCMWLNELWLCFMCYVSDCECQ